jgi:hypothetical protein
VYQNGKIPMAAQAKFTVENGMIHGGGSYALLVTNREFGYYRIRVDYRFGAAVGSDGNAGMMILMDNEGAKTVTALRPRSIEINCRRDRDYPWTLWSATNLGPVMATTVKPGTALFQTKADGGVPYTVEPAGNRILESAYANPELPPGTWNRGEALVLGDSGLFYLNGRFRTASWKWRVDQGGKQVRVARGGVGLQTEGFDIWYRNWEIQELDSATSLPLHAVRGCTDPAKRGYDPHAVVDDGKCGTTALVDRRLDRTVDSKPDHEAFARGPRRFDGYTVDGRGAEPLDPAAAQPPKGAVPR